MVRKTTVQTPLIGASTAGIPRHFGSDRYREFIWDLSVVSAESHRRSWRHFPSGDEHARAQWRGNEVSQFPVVVELMNQEIGLFAGFQRP